MSHSFLFVAASHLYIAYLIHCHVIFILYLCIENHAKEGIHFTPRKSMKIILDDFWSGYHTLLRMSINFVTSEIILNYGMIFILLFCCVYS